MSQPGPPIRSIAAMWLTSAELLEYRALVEPPRRPHFHNDDALALTEGLRTSDDPQWAAVREHLTGAGYDPQRSAVGDLFPEDIGYFGVLVASDRSTHTFMVGTEPIHGEPGKHRWWVTHDEETTAESRFAYAPAMFSAMTLLESEEPTGVRPLDLLVDHCAVLTKEFRGLAERRWGERRAENNWDVLHTFMRDRSTEPMQSVALYWAWTLSDPEIDGGVMDPSGQCFHFAGTLQTMHGPIGEITTWDELDSSAARLIYGEYVDAGVELLRRESEARA
jgi:hypothetical protein